MLPIGAPPGLREQRDTGCEPASIGHWFPNEFGNVDDEVGARAVRIVRGTDLTDAHAHDVIEPSVPLAVTDVQHGADDLPSPGWIGAAVSMTLEHDRRAVVGIDDGAKVRNERACCCSTLREVRAAEATRDAALAAALCKVQVLLPPSLESYHPTLRIGEADSVQLLEPQRFSLPIHQRTSHPDRSAALRSRRLLEGGYFTMAEPPRRVNFFEGQILTAADLAAEQEYHRGMRYLHNRLHGYGTASGLDVDVTRGRVRVSPGMGIDALGREIVVTAPLSLRLEPHRNTRRWIRDLVIVWHEVPESPVPSQDGTVDFTRWVEQPELLLVARGRAAPEGLVLARLTRTNRGPVDVDTSVRRPLGPADPCQGMAGAETVSPSAGRS